MYQIDGRKTKLQFWSSTIPNKKDEIVEFHEKCHMWHTFLSRIP